MRWSSWFVVAATLAAIPALQARASTPIAYYELDDLGELGGDSQVLDFTEPHLYLRGHHLACRIGSVNGINESGEVVATRIDSDGNSYVTVDQEVLPSTYPPSVGCSISDDRYVVGQDALGAAVWYAPYGTFREYPTAVAPANAVDSILFSITKRGRTNSGPIQLLSAAGAFRTVADHVRPYLGTYLPDLSLQHPQLSEMATVNGIAYLPDSNLTFYLVGTFHDGNAAWSEPRPFWLYSAPGLSYLDTPSRPVLGSVFHAVTSRGTAVGCHVGPGQSWSLIHGSSWGERFDPPHGSCLFDINESEVGAGYARAGPGMNTGHLSAPDGFAYMFDSMRQGIPFVDAQQSGWIIESIHGINARGELAANAIHPNGKRHAVRLRPTTIPDRLEVVGPFETHPEVEGPFLRASKKIDVRLHLDRPAPIYSTGQEFQARLVGSSDFFTIPAGSLRLDVELTPQARPPVPTPFSLAFELNGVLATAVVQIVSDVEIDCSDGLDNDFDGFLDCQDTDCNGKECDHPTGLPATCVNGICVAHEEHCDDGLDDDLDGLTDCEDPDCAFFRCAPGMFCLPDAQGDLICSPPPHEYMCVDIEPFSYTSYCPRNCYSGEDEDGDGKEDCQDEDCYGLPCSPDGGAVCGTYECHEADCRNGHDDDNDKLVDCDDFDCDGKECSPFPAGKAICEKYRCVEADCCNRIDDDDDQLMDCADPDCHGKVCPDLEFGFCVCDSDQRRCVDCSNCESEVCDGQVCGGGKGICRKGICG